MRPLIFILTVLTLFGCGGEAFDSALFVAAGGSDGTGGETATGGAPDDGGPGTGGATSTGGSDATGGAPETGGATATGGAPETGGETSTGGALGTGGVSTGGATATGGAPGTGGATTCTLVTHDNGLGQTWQDCEPLGTFTQAQATKACLAAGAAQCYSLTGCGIPYYEVRGYTAGGSAIGFWMYGGPTAGYVNSESCGSAPCVVTACTVNWN